MTTMNEKKVLETEVNFALDSGNLPWKSFILVCFIKYLVKVYQPMLCYLKVSHKEKNLQLIRGDSSF